MEKSLDGRTLSQLLAAHNVLHILPSSKRMGEFVARALTTIPGIDSAGMCTRDLSAPAGSLDFKACLNCERAWKNGNDIALNDCLLASNEGTRGLLIKTADRFYGFLLLGVERTEDFILYEPFLKNFANSIAIILENRWQKGRLTQRTAELEAANKELEAFSHSVSHDLRAPLRAMAGFSKMLLEDHGKQLDAQGADYLGRVCAGAQKMGLLIDDLLRLSTIATRELRPERIDLATIARSATARLEEVEPERHVEFVSPKSLPATGDVRLLETALDNLLSNAWKFTANQVAARIELGLTEWDGRPAYYIRDNGAGFNMAYAGQLFQPFRRLHRDDEFPGAGVGLATVQRIVRRHGGDIWAEAEVGRGATFYFTLGERQDGEQ